MEQDKKKEKNSILAKAARGLYFTFLTVMYRPKIIYCDGCTKEMLREQGVIYAINHTGHNDGQIAFMKLEKGALLIARDWYDKKIVKWICQGRKIIPIDRFGLDTEWLREMVKASKEGFSPIIFPEGKTSKDGEIHEFKAGFIMLSVMTGAPIVPVYIDGEYHKLFGKRLRMYIGKPTALSTEGKGLQAEYLNRESERFQKIVIDIREKHER